MNQPTLAPKTSVQSSRTSAELLEVLQAKMTKNGTWKSQYNNLTIDCLIAKVGTAWNVFDRKTEGKTKEQQDEYLDSLASLFKRRLIDQQNSLGYFLKNIW